MGVMKLESIDILSELFCSLAAQRANEETDDAQTTALPYT